MEYIHIRSLEKYHPGYKDRELQWAKVYLNMAVGDPEVEALCEIDHSRLIKMILLELRAKKPLPNNDEYWQSKGFDLKKRPISLTIEMLHNFIEVVTQLSKDCVLDKSRVDKNREEKSNVVSLQNFESLWTTYPNRVGRKAAERSFGASVKSTEDFAAIQTALKNYLESERVAKGFVQNGSTWFANWRDWVEPPKKGNDDIPPSLRHLV